MTESTSEQQMNIWKNELDMAMDNEQWRQALKFCGWLLHALRQQDSLDPEVVAAHRRAKEALAKQLTIEKTANEKHRQQHDLTMWQIISGDWENALISIEDLYKDRTNRHEVIYLLQEFKGRTQTLLTSGWRGGDPQVSALGKRFDELWEQVAVGSKKIKNILLGDALGDKL